MPNIHLVFAYDTVDPNGSPRANGPRHRNGPYPTPNLWDFTRLDKNVRWASTSKLIGSATAFIYEVKMNAPLERLLAVSDEVWTPSKIALNAIRRGQAILLFSAYWEGDRACDALFLSLHEKLARWGVPCHRAVVATSNLLFADRYAQWAHGKNQQKLNVVSLDYFGDYMKALPGEDFLTEDQAFSRLDRTHHFMSLNRRPKQHRFIAVSQLLKHGLLKKGLVSLGATSVGQHYKVDYEMYQAHFPDLRTDLKQLQKIVPLIVDRSDFQTSFVSVNPKTPYLDSYINFTTETFFEHSFGKTIFHTEKTYKPIFNFQPFILAGAPGQLRSLREIGFETFGGIIDERYDDIEDDGQRLSAIISELTRFGEFPLDKMRGMYQDCIPTLKRNAAHAALRPYSTRALAGMLRTLLNFGL